VKFSIYQESRIGKRKSNQDRNAYCYSRDALLMVIADGMGGHLHGEVAAHIAVQFIVQSFQSEATPAIADPVIFLSQTLNKAHSAIIDYAFDKDLPEAPRTTIVACIVQGGDAYWAHAGDSRLYVVRSGHVVAQTRDHSRVQLMLDQGLIDAEEAARHPGRNRIYSCLGGNHAPQIDFSRRFALRDGDVITLCTDGLWGPVGETGIVRMATSNIMASSPRLLNEAEILGGKACDNLSLITMCWHDEANPVDGDSVSTRTLALNDFTTRLETFDRGRTAANEFDLTDDEIERAIAEINSAITKFSK
jgi:serine/threonine protein phosphatase PrpC